MHFIQRVPTRALRRNTSRIFWSCLVGLLVSSTASAQDQDHFCDRPLTTEALFKSKAGTDLYNAALWLGGSAGVSLSSSHKIHWSKVNGFDDGIRDGLRAGSRSARKDADFASDILLGIGVGIVPAISIGKVLFSHDCHIAYDMLTDAVESIALTTFSTQDTKIVSGRTRPYAEDCSGPLLGSSLCGKSDINRSFFSGHASLAATGAGLSCAYAMKRKTWGEGRTARFLPCALGASVAVTTGVLRVVADKHWTSDVIIGLMVGGAVGYFDTWGPFDWLRFELESDDMALQAKGVLLPYASGGEIGLALGIAF